MVSMIRDEFLEAKKMLEDFLADGEHFIHIENAGKVMVESLGAGHKVIACGNGGSMSDAMHFAEELTGRFRHDRKALAAVAVSDPAHITCTANDYGFDHIFSRYVEAVGQPGDVLLAISTSGNSANVLKAAEAARAKGMKVVALTGHDGGKLADACDVEIRAPRSKYSDRVQEIHIKVIHTLIHYIEQQTQP